MKKWKDIPGNEKWMIALIVLLLLGIIIRWGFVKDGIGRGFDWFDRDTPADSTELELTIPSDTFPPEQPEILLVPAPENE